MANLEFKKNTAPPDNNKMPQPYNEVREGGEVVGYEPKDKKESPGMYGKQGKEAARNLSNTLSENFHKLDSSKGLWGTIPLRLAAIYGAGKIYSAFLGRKLEFGNGDHDKALNKKLLEGATLGDPLDPATVDTKNNNISHRSYAVEGLPKLRDSIILINLDKKDDAAKGRKVGYEGVELPFIPREVNVNPESRFASLPSIGRNLNYYHFTGAEKTIEFEIDWYADDEYRETAIANCRKVESWSMANGFLDNPPRIQILWGEGNSLFDDSIWLLLKAPYRLSNFSKATIISKGKYRRNSLLPVQAYQTVTLAKIGTITKPSKDTLGNLTWDQITGETSNGLRSNSFYDPITF